MNPALVDYGTDLAWGLVTVTLPFPDGSTRMLQVNDVDPNFAEVSGRACLAQALARRLITPRLGLIDDPDYGLDVRDWLNDDVTPAEIAKIGRLVEAELLKDERVVRAAASVTFVTGVLTITASITDGAGTFRLVLAVSELSAKLLEAAA